MKIVRKRYRDGGHLLLYGERSMIAGLFVGKRFLGFRLGRRYFKARDLEQHPLAYTERNRHGYTPIARIVDRFELGVRA